MRKGRKGQKDHNKRGVREIQAFTNESENRFSSYQDGDELRLVFHNTITLPVDIDEHEICSSVYQVLNEDDRPNRGFARSLSIGDVITVITERITKSYAVESMGFRYLLLCRVATPHEKGHVTKLLAAAAARAERSKA